MVTRASQKCFSFSTKTAIIQIDNFLVPLFLIPDFATLSFFFSFAFGVGTGPAPPSPVFHDLLIKLGEAVDFCDRNIYNVTSSF